MANGKIYMPNAFKKITISNSIISDLSRGSLWGQNSEGFIWYNDSIVIFRFAVHLQSISSGIMGFSITVPSDFPPLSLQNNIGRAYRKISGTGTYMLPGDTLYITMSDSTHLWLSERNMFTSHPAADYATIQVDATVII